MRTVMTKSLLAAALATVGLMGTANANSQPGDKPNEVNASDGRIELGYLNCEFTDGSSIIVKTERMFDCTFKPANGERPTETYQATIANYGVDLRVTDEKTMRWAVLAPSSFNDRGVLEGNYGGISADAALGYSVGADVLVGGLEESVALQPVAISTGEGLGAAVGYEEVTLTFTGVVPETQG